MTFLSILKRHTNLWLLLLLRLMTLNCPIMTPPSTPDSSHYSDSWHSTVLLWLLPLLRVVTLNCPFMTPPSTPTPPTTHAPHPLFTHYSRTTSFIFFNKWEHRVYFGDILTNTTTSQMSPSIYMIEDTATDIIYSSKQR